MITIIGLGHTSKSLTQGAKETFLKAAAVALRTQKTKAGAAAASLLSKAAKPFQTFDALYDQSDNFDVLSNQIALAVAALEKEHGDAVYCVDGDGFTDAAAVILSRIASVTVYGGVPAKKPCMSCVQISATELLAKKPYLDSALPLYVTEVGDRMLCGEVKLYLNAFYAEDTPVRLYTGGVESDVPLYEIDRFKKYDYATAFFVDGAEALPKTRYGFGDLVRILSRLTAPDGCPWDQAQTHESIRINLIEEAYEAVDAIDSGDESAMCEEFGDVLLQAAFHCNMAERTGEFGLGDVLSTLCNKLYFRHTHIFGADNAVSADEALKFWDKAKATEKHYDSVSDQLNRLPQNFPSLLRAQKTLKKTAKVGFGTSDYVHRAMESLNAFDRKTDEASAGALLLACVDWLSSKHIDAEVALLGAVRKHADAFALFEKNKASMPENSDKKQNDADNTAKIKGDNA